MSSLLVYLSRLQVQQGDSEYGGSRKEVQGRVAATHFHRVAGTLFVCHLGVSNRRVYYTLSREFLNDPVIKRSY